MKYVISGRRIYPKPPEGMLRTLCGAGNRPAKRCKKGGAYMKKNGQQLEKEQLFSAETAGEFFPEERSKPSSTPHKDRLKVKDKNFSKNFKSEKTGENKSYF